VGGGTGRIKKEFNSKGLKKGGFWGREEEREVYLF
jgi:hypothetical protein